MNENINNCPSAYFKWTVMVEFKNPLGIFNLDDFSYLYDRIKKNRRKGILLFYSSTALPNI